MLDVLRLWIKQYKEDELECVIRSLAEVLLTLYYGDEPKRYKSICLNERLKHLSLCDKCPVDKSDVARLKR
jgi:hypothetical protein